jgi:hypothetical protein
MKPREALEKIKKHDRREINYLITPSINEEKEVYDTLEELVRKNEEAEKITEEFFKKYYKGE